MNVNSSKPPVANRRKKRLVRLDLQIKVVFITLFVACFVLLINFQLTLASLWSLAGQFSGKVASEQLLDGIRSAVIQKFFISIGIALPLAVSVGILYSFRFCGPIYRFKEYMRSAAQGRWDKRCLLREGDDLKDVAEAINGVMDEVRARMQAHHELFRATAELLDAADLSGDESLRPRVRSLREGIAAEETIYAKRLGPAGGDRAAAALPGKPPAAGEEQMQPPQRELESATESVR